MSNYWLVTGAVKTATGSLDTWFDTTIGSTAPSYVKGKDYAYIGIAATGNVTSSFWASGSNNNINDRNAQMFTEFPTGTEVGKLYFINGEVFNDDALTGSLPGDRNAWADLEFVTGGGDYFIITPFNGGFFKYNFIDLDDLWDNGWRVSKAGSSDTPLDKTKWDNNKDSGTWLSTYGLDSSIGSQKEQIIANMLGASPGSVQIDGGSPYFKGAILIAAGGGAGGDWSNYNYVVPINDAPL